MTTTKTTTGRYEVLTLGAAEPPARHATKYDACIEAERRRDAHHADRIGVQVVVVDRRNGAGEVARWVGVEGGFGWEIPAILAVHKIVAPPIREVHRAIDPGIAARTAERAGRVW